MPLPVKDFLEKVDICSASYIFIVVTKGGSASKVFQEAARLMRTLSAPDAELVSAFAP